MSSQIEVTYWANLEGHKLNHPPQKVLQQCRVKQKKQLHSFGWKIQENINEIKQQPNISIIPPWILGQGSTDLHFNQK